MCNINLLCSQNENNAKVITKKVQLNFKPRSAKIVLSTVGIISSQNEMFKLFFKLMKLFSRIIFLTEIHD